MIKIKFIRYDNYGTHEEICEVPEHIVKLYPQHEKNSMKKRNRVWLSKEIGRFPFGCHILEGLLYNEDFLRSYAPSWVIKRMRKYTSNPYVSLYNSEDSEIPDSKVGKKERKPREPKKVDESKEKRISFKRMRTKINNKINVFKSLSHIDGLIKVQGFGYGATQAEKEYYDNIITQIFKSYKTFFEETLDSRNIGFFVSNEQKNIPYGRHSKGLSVEYVLVNNKEKFDISLLSDRSWEKITLVWYPCNKKVQNERGYYDYKAFLDPHRGGLVSGDCRFIKKTQIKCFKSMRESTFSKLIDSTLIVNNSKYEELTKGLKLKKDREIINKTEEEKLNTFLVNKIIPLVDPKFVHHPSLNFDESFRIRLTKEEDNYGIRFRVLEISKTLDEFNDLTFRLDVFNGLKTVRFKTAKESIKFINKVFGKNFKKVIKVINNVIQS